MIILLQNEKSKFRNFFDRKIFLGRYKTVSHNSYVLLPVQNANFRFRTLYFRLKSTTLKKFTHILLVVKAMVLGQNFWPLKMYISPLFDSFSVFDVHWPKPFSPFPLTGSCLNFLTEFQNSAAHWYIRHNHVRRNSL